MVVAEYEIWQVVGFMAMGVLCRATTPDRCTSLSLGCQARRARLVPRHGNSLRRIRPFDADMRGQGS